MTITPKNFNEAIRNAFIKRFRHRKLATCHLKVGGALHYLKETQQKDLTHLQGLSRMDSSQSVWLDRFTIRNLELLEASSEGGMGLFQVIDRTATPMGARLLRRWLVFPLKDLQPILDRQEIVAWFVEHENTSADIRSELKQLGDLERLLTRVATGRVSPRELVQLNRSLKTIAPIRASLMASAHLPLKQLADQLNPCELLIERLTKELNEDAPAL